MSRFWVTGGSGSGKSTLARAIAARTGVRWIELDGLFHQPNWTPRPREELRAEVDELTRGDGWVVDGNYGGMVGELLLARADVIVLLDLPRSLVMRQVIGRTARRLVTRRELWNGNRERLRNVLSTDPGRSIIRWAWVSHGKPIEYWSRVCAGARPDQRLCRLRDREQVAAFVAEWGGPG